MKQSPEIERLVQEAKAEMIREGTRYKENDKYFKYNMTPRRKGVKIKPETKEDKLPDGIQFRGTPGKKTKMPELIKGNKSQFLYFGGKNGE